MGMICNQWWSDGSQQICVSICVNLCINIAIYQCAGTTLGLLSQACESWLVFIYLAGDPSRKCENAVHFLVNKDMGVPGVGMI